MLLSFHTETTAAKIFWSMNNYAKWTYLNHNYIRHYSCTMSDYLNNTYPSILYTDGYTLLDEEQDIVTVIKHSLQNCGPRAFTFTSQFLALEHFGSSYNGYWLILSDVTIPGMNGFKFAKKVTDIDQTVRIMLMSAFEITSILPLPKKNMDLYISIRKLKSVIEHHCWN
jgi:CheY-like chemotaxis protein